MKVNMLFTLVSVTAFLAFQNSYVVVVVVVVVVVLRGWDTTSSDITVMF